AGGTGCSTRGASTGSGGGTAAGGAGGSAALAGGNACAGGAGGAPDLAGGSACPTSSMRATTVLMPTVLPSSTRISARMPAAGDGISVSTLSVEISNSGSSRSMRSPGFLSHLVSVPSTMLSPIWGMTTSGISVLQHLAIENPGEVNGEFGAHLAEACTDAEHGHRGHGLGQSAGNDVLKIAQVGGHVEREAVRGDPSAEVHPDGGDLALAHPHAGQFGNPAGGNAVLRQSGDDGLFHRAHIRADIALPIAQIEDGIAHQLSGTVVRHVAPAIDGI